MDINSTYESLLEQVRPKKQRPTYTVGMINPKGKFIHAQPHETGHQAISRRLGYNDPGAAIRAGHVRWYKYKAPMRDADHFYVEYDPSNPQAKKYGERAMHLSKKLGMKAYRSDTYGDWDYK